MKVAYHFDADHPRLGKSRSYGWSVEQHVLGLIAGIKRFGLSTKVFIGDLLLACLAENTVLLDEGLYQVTVNQAVLAAAVEAWLRPRERMWVRLHESIGELAATTSIYVMCFETIDLELAKWIDAQLEDYPSYVGCMGIDDADRVCYELYSHLLAARYRLHGGRASVFWDGADEDDKDHGLLGQLSTLGFDGVDFEPLKGMYTILDTHHDFENARRLAECNRMFNEMLESVASRVLHSLSDVAPDLGEKMWVALDTLHRASSAEQLSQVALSCRRIVHYIADCIFPPNTDIQDGHKLGPKQFRNRLRAYAEKERIGTTSTDLLLINSDALNSQIEKLDSLVNKGVHDQVSYAEVTRCVLRTLMLLDDLVAFRTKPFEAAPDLDYTRVLGPDS